MKLHNKFLIIFVLLFGFLILFNISNVKATIEFDYNGTHHSFKNIPSDFDTIYDNYFIYYDKDNSFNRTTNFVIVYYPDTCNCYFNSLDNNTQFDNIL